MSQLYKRMYTKLFGRVEDVLEHIEGKMRIPQSEDWMYTKEVHGKLQAALQECEDLYVDAEEEEGNRIYEGDEKHKIENILKAFEGFIREQEYFEIFYSEKRGYVFLYIKDYEERSKPLKTAKQAIDSLFYQVMDEVVYGPGNEQMEHNSSALTEYEEAETRRRLTTIVETLEEDRDYWLPYIDEYLKDYQRKNIDS